MVSTDVLEVLAKEFYYAYQKIMIDAMPETNEKEIEEKKKAIEQQESVFSDKLAKFTRAVDTVKASLADQKITFTSAFSKGN